ncbi:hypothetical protein BOX15_Mlig022908g1 [Macrostomum lignano]|uniref:Septin-type G domain-containing protein n=2 Tax=Macrostomum lignano TaxID=282301 RepID=A0A1I8GF38_9PLAT|nr:hypothetical protein BOX15_Mlig022908g1 [Macrostomum lignano]
MSSDSESFTSHSGSLVEQQLNSALETAAVSSQPRVTGAAAAPSPSGSVGNHRIVENSSESSFSDEVGDGEGGGVELADQLNHSSESGMQQQQQVAPDDFHGSAVPRENGQLEDDWSVSQVPPVQRTSSHMEFSGRDLELRSLSRQLCKKSARRGFDFKLMLVGESGIGKTTLIDSLFNVESTRNLGSQYVRGQRDATSTTRLCERFFELEEGGVTVRLTVIDTPGFATELDSNGCVQPVLSYVERQLDDFYRMEQGTDRSKLQDGRVHALLYLINPSSRGLKQLDLMCLKALHSKVNIVPVIGKADTLTTSEKANLKAWILQDLSRHGISVYTLPEFDECFGNQADQHGDDVYLRNQYDSLRSCMPLAVVGANQLVKNANGQWARVREYPWGVVDIDNPEFSDFLKLRELLIMYMEDFKDKTHEVIYEQIRLNRLRQSDWQMSRMTKTLAERERLLREKDEELRRLRDAVEGLQRASTSSDSNSKSSSLPTAASQADRYHQAGPSSRTLGSNGASTRLASSSSAAYSGQLRSRAQARSSYYN